MSNFKESRDKMARVQKPTHRTTQKHVEQHATTDI